MSIDAYLVVETGGREPALVTSGINHTHNTSGMWTKALEHANARAVRNDAYRNSPLRAVDPGRDTPPGDFLVPYGWTFYQFLEGGISHLPDPDRPRMPGRLGHSFATNLPLNPPTAIQAARVLKAMIFEMEAQPDYFRTMNPDNGWGSYESALEFLLEFLADCERHPNATVVVSL